MRGTLGRTWLRMLLVDQPDDVAAEYRGNHVFDGLAKASSVACSITDACEIPAVQRAGRGGIVGMDRGYERGAASACPAKGTRLP